MLPAEKEAWTTQAGADKAHYLHKLTICVPQPRFDCRGDDIITPLADDEKKKHRKLDCDPNAPKCSVSIYLLYQVSVTSWNVL